MRSKIIVRHCSTLDLFFIHNHELSAVWTRSINLNTIYSKFGKESKLNSQVKFLKKSVHRMHGPPLFRLHMYKMCTYITYTIQYIFFFIIISFFYFSYDTRGPHAGTPSHWKDEEVLENRAVFRAVREPAELFINPVLVIICLLIYNLYVSCLLCTYMYICIESEYVRGWDSCQSLYKTTEHMYNSIF